MKKILSLLLVSAMLVAGMAGCNGNSSSESSAEETTVAEVTTEATTKAPATTAKPVETTKAAETTVAATTAAATTKAAVTTAAATTKAAVTTAAATKAPAATTAAPAAAANTGYTPVASLTGTVSFSGSTSVYPACAALTEAFKKHYPKVKVSITNVTGSGAGLADAKSGNVSFGMRSSAWKTSDGANIVPYQIAMDGVAIVVNPANAMTEINFQGIKDAFEGKTNTLSNPISREAGSGTKTCFEDVLKGGVGIPAYPAGVGQIATSTDAVGTNVANNANSIGYMSLGSTPSTVKKLKVEGVEATEENVLNGSYKFARPFLFLRRNDRPMSDAEKEFLKFALSEEGQKVIANSNFIALSSTQIATELAKVK